MALHMGEWEYCFEFLLNDNASATVLKNAYMKAGLPSNGVVVTSGLFTMINAFSYGLIAIVIIAISILLIIMSVLCLSYIIRATMAEENQSIGEMKAIGIQGCGYGDSQWMKWVFSFEGVVLLSLFVMLRCHRIIRKNLRSTVMELMRGEEKTSR